MHVLEDWNPCISSWLDSWIIFVWKMFKLSSGNIFLAHKVRKKYLQKNRKYSCLYTKLTHCVMNLYSPVEVNLVIPVSKQSYFTSYLLVSLLQAVSCCLKYSVCIYIFFFFFRYLNGTSQNPDQNLWTSYEVRWKRT